MYKVLIIAHQFPPMGGAGVQRTIKFIKYLPLFNWNSTVLTRDDKNLEIKDKTLLSDLPDNTKVYRTNSYDLTNLKGIMHIPGKIIARKLLIPDSEIIWQFFARKTALNILSTEKLDFIYTTSSPYSDHLLGYYLKNKFPLIPWIADFRDEWTNNPYTLDNPHNKIRTTIEKSMEKKVLASANALITNSLIMKNNFIRNNQNIKSLKNKFYVIPNGFDKDDFKDQNSKHNKNDKFTITYTGAFYGRRKPDLFLLALKELIDENLIQRNLIFVKLIGHFRVDILNSLIKEMHLSNFVKVHTYMNHESILNELAKSDCLLLIEGGGKGSEAFFTGKVFEYINAKKPILAVIPEKGVAADLIRATKTGFISDCFDKENTKKNILFLYNNWLNNKESIEPDWSIINKYERKNLTKSLVKIFEEYRNKG